MTDLSQKNNLAKKFVDFLIKWLGVVFSTAAILALGGIILVVLFQIFARVALPKSPVWTEELSRYLFIYSIVLASAAVIFNKRHVTLEVFHQRLPKKVRLIYSALCYIIVAVFGMMLLEHAWAFTENGIGQMTTTLGVEKSWIFGSTVVFFSLVILASLLMAASDILSTFEKEAE